MPPPRHAKPVPDALRPLWVSPANALKSAETCGQIVTMLKQFHPQQQARILYAAAVMLDAPTYHRNP